MARDRLRFGESRSDAFLQGPDEEEETQSQPEEQPPKPKKIATSEMKAEQEKHLVVHYADKTSRLLVTPEAFIEPPGPKAYAEDSFDKVLPAPGFVTDYVNACRGIEAPTLHLIWAALWTVSTCLKREANIRWYPKKLWPNLYVMLVAPPALCRKSSSMEIGVDLLRRLPDLMPSTTEAFKKSTKFVSSKCTPEGLVMLLEPENRSFIGERDNGKQFIQQIKKGSQVAIAVSELPTFLGRQQYNLGMVNLLLDLYDCKDKDDEITRGRGVSAVENVYTTFVGAVTPEGLRLAVPEEAFGGGFMSRVVIAYQDTPTKIYAFPRALEGYPSVDDLLPKLAWIAYWAKGEYYFTEGAMATYEKWYNNFKAELFTSPVERFEEYRLDTLILKVACLLRIQEYRTGFDITEQNINDAERLLRATMRRSKAATEDVGAGEYRKQMNLVRRAVQKDGSIERRLLLRKVSAYGIPAARLNEILSQLHEEGFLKIMLQGHRSITPSAQGDEKYELLKGGDNGEQETAGTA